MIQIWKPKHSATVVRLDSVFAHGDGLPCRRIGTTANRLGDASIRRVWTGRVLSAIACSIRGDVKNILLPPPEARLWFAASSPLSDRSDARVLCLALWFRVLLCSISAAACSLVATTPIGF